jgi:hypothetical protein
MNVQVAAEMIRLAFAELMRRKAQGLTEPT